MPWSGQDDLCQQFCLVLFTIFVVKNSLGVAGTDLLDIDYTFVTLFSSIVL